MSFNRFHENKKDKLDFDNLLQWQCLPLKLLGIFSFEFDYIPSWRILQSSLKILKFVHILVVFLLPTLMAVSFAKSSYDMRSAEMMIFLNCLGNCFWFTNTTLTLATFFTYREKVKEIIDFVNKKFKRRSQKGMNYVTIEKIHQILSCVTVIWTILPAVSVLYFTLQNAYSGDKKLPMESWYPIDTKSPSVYILLYIQQMLSQLVAMTICTGGGMLFVSTVILTCSQYNALFCDLKNIPYNAMILAKVELQIVRDYHRSNKSFDEELNQYFCCEEIEEVQGDDREKSYSVTTNRRFPLDLTPYLRKCIQRAIKDCVQHHIIILKFTKKLESFFSLFAFIRISEITMELCITGFMAVTSGQKLSAISSAEYGFLSLLDLALITFPAEMLRQQSVKVGDALMRTPWHDFCRYFKNDFLIIQAFSLRPVTLTAGKFITLGIDQFIAAVTGAFSYYTFLQNMAVQNEN